MTRKIRILFTTSNFDTAGSGKVIYDLVKGLNKSRFDIEIACGNDKGYFFETIKSLEVPVHVFSTKTTYRPYITLPVRILKLVKFFRKQRYDIVHSWQWSNDWTEAVASKMSGSKWIYTKKAMGFANKHWYIKSLLADFIITINDEMSQYFPNKKEQELIPLGLDTGYYSPIGFEKRASEVFRIVTVANLVPVKGIEFLIRSISMINDPFISVTIVGDDDSIYGEKLKELAKTLDVDSKVHFLGKKPDVRPYLADADLYVIPTLDEGRKEGMPMALVEAMSMGVPLLGSDITGINYVLKDFPELLFKPANVKALTEKILYMKNLGPEELSKIGIALRNYCQEHFTVNRFVAAHELLYEKLA
ncbi:glycosyltransferase [Subsaxibacter sp. CAU 1640]|uniref:glycosyltransferase n=1 Tax=Subsaxibacter sp. CAU 1640 TaxID=2933271 RepID=UPI0020067FC8|nr:glycosyltransferase [Subsaxibacter sp. CAU 1640]MCK7589896.1 glycosyltransferase [Subsaxibacter sp. CAU 1640]